MVTNELVPTVILFVSSIGAKQSVIGYGPLASEPQIMCGALSAAGNGQSSLSHPMALEKPDNMLLQVEFCRSAIQLATALGQLPR